MTGVHCHVTKRAVISLVVQPIPFTEWSATHHLSSETSPSPTAAIYQTRSHYRVERFVGATVRAIGTAVVSHSSQIISSLFSTAYYSSRNACCVLSNKKTVFTYMRSLRQPFRNWQTNFHRLSVSTNDSRSIPVHEETLDRSAQVNTTDHDGRVAHNNL